MEILTGEHNKKLRGKAKEIKRMTKDIHLLAKAMKDLMVDKNGVGLAAPQVGHDLRLIVCDSDLSGKKILVLINPEIIKFSDEKELGEEGCLSLPDIWGQVERSKNIVVKYKTLTGRKIKKEYKDIAARIIQHEIDHLEGILFVDRAKSINKKE